MNAKLNRKLSPRTLRPRADWSGGSRALDVRSHWGLSARLNALKQFLWVENSLKLPGQEQILRSALNEAEALAWQTPYPHLFFPVLAQEKADAAMHWAVRQQAVRLASPYLAFAA